MTKRGAASRPMSEAEIRSAFYDDGLSVVQIASKARRQNGIGRAEVRRILFGETA